MDAGISLMPTFYFISIYPHIFKAYCEVGVIGAALKKNLAKIEFLDLRQFAVDKHGSIDSRPYGGGEGMVLRPEPLALAIKSIEPKPYVILTSPAGRVWRQQDAIRCSQFDSRPTALICGRFSGVDQRFVDHYVDEQISLGDFVLAGGELAAMAMIESCIRLVPGVLGQDESAVYDSFSPGFSGRLEHPLYSKPQEFEGKSVPDVLLSGDHLKIAQWRQKESLTLTQRQRPDLLPSALDSLKSIK